MLLIFAAVFGIAVIFSVLLFLTFESDVKKKSFRPFFLLAFALIGWSMTLPALVTPNQSITVYSGYNISTSTGNILVPTYNSTSSSNVPFPASTLYTYLPFYIAMISIHSLVMILWLMSWFKQLKDDAMDEAWK